MAWFASVKNDLGDSRSGIALEACSWFHATRSARLVSWGSGSKFVEIKSLKTPENSWSRSKFSDLLPLDYGAVGI